MNDILIPNGVRDTEGLRIRFIQIEKLNYGRELLKYQVLNGSRLAASYQAPHSGIHDPEIPDFWTFRVHNLHAQQKLPVTAPKSLLDNNTTIRQIIL